MTYKSTMKNVRAIIILGIVMLLKSLYSANENGIKTWINNKSIRWVYEVCPQIPCTPKLKGIDIKAACKEYMIIER